LCSTLSKCGISLCLFGAAPQLGKTLILSGWFRQPEKQSSPGLLEPELLRAMMPSDPNPKENRGGFRIRQSKGYHSAEKSQISGQLPA
jgi:hypothetical protein